MGPSRRSPSERAGRRSWRRMSGPGWIDTDETETYDDAEREDTRFQSQPHRLTLPSVAAPGLSVAR